MYIYIYISIYLYIYIYIYIYGFDRVRGAGSFFVGRSTRCRTTSATCASRPSRPKEYRAGWETQIRPPTRSAPTPFHGQKGTWGQKSTGRDGRREPDSLRGSFIPRVITFPYMAQCMGASRSKGS